MLFAQHSAIVSWKQTHYELGEFLNQYMLKWIYQTTHLYCEDARERFNSIFVCCFDCNFFNSQISLVSYCFIAEYFSFISIHFHFSSLQRNC